MFLSSFVLEYLNRNLSCEDQKNTERADLCPEKLITLSKSVSNKLFEVIIKLLPKLN